MPIKTAWPFERSLVSDDHTPGGDARLFTGACSPGGRETPQPFGTVRVIEGDLSAPGDSKLAPTIASFGATLAQVVARPSSSDCGVLGGAESLQQVLSEYLAQGSAMSAGHSTGLWFPRDLHDMNSTLFPLKTIAVKVIESEKNDLLN